MREYFEKVVNSAYHLQKIEENKRHIAYMSDISRTGIFLYKVYANLNFKYGTYDLADTRFMDSLWNLHFEELKT